MFAAFKGVHETEARPGNGHYPKFFGYMFSGFRSSSYAATRDDT
jgi:hypothetical protein